MNIEKLDRGLVIHSPAKVNLFLDVLKKRADGYHQIDSIICPVTLFDKLTIEPDDSGRVNFSVLGGAVPSTDQSPAWDGISRSIATQVSDPAWHIPEDGSNLVVRALQAVRTSLASAGHAAGGCSVVLHKAVPAAAGLGGGSSNAAAAIVGGLVLWSHWDRSLATRLAASLGSDIPLFLGDEVNGIGLAHATGRGESVEILAGRPPLTLVISHPPVGSSTAEVYSKWRDGAGIPSGRRTSAEMCQSIQCESTQGDTQEYSSRRIEASLFNALQHPAAQINPWIDRQLAWYAQLGRPNALLTGSGSACFTLVDSPEQGQQLVENLIAFGLPRAYTVQAWYAPPIEQQLDRILNPTLP